MLEATQTATTPILFKAGRQWEGRVVGNFRLRQYLGSTERSTVFLTELPGEQGRKAAIKLVAAGPNADVQLGRWRLAAKLSHQHLLQIFEVGSCQISGDNLLFVVTEYADETLSQILPERPLTEAEAREMLKPTLDALAYSHDNGFAHGHLSPNNILVVGERLKLSSDRLCRTGAPIPPEVPKDAYYPPEAEQEGLTPAGDVWSLGIILVESLTQRLPEWKNRLVEDPSIPVEVPHPFGAMARRCLVRDPRSRWTVPQIFTELEPPVIASKPARQTKPAETKDKPTKDITTLVYAGGLIAIVLVALALASLLRHSSDVHPGSTTSSEAATNAATQPAAASAATNSTQPAAPGGIVHQVVPIVPESALQTIQGKVRVTVKVHVDSAGNVANAEFQRRGPSGYFANFALQAAKGWKFAAGAPRTWVLEFVFGTSGVGVHPRQIG